MITFHELGKYGRLGNQLFQYAALKGLGLKKGYQVKIPTPTDMAWHGQTCLLDQFNIECGYLHKGDLNLITSMYEESNPNDINDNFFEVPDNTTLKGFFQSTCYFKDFESQIKKELTPKQEWVDKADKVLNDIRLENPGYELVSLHMRRGDNTDGSDANPLYINMYGNNNGFSWESPYGQYLKKSMEVFKDKKVKFLIFTGGKKWTDDNSEDLEWCNTHFKGDKFIYPTDSSTMLDFSLIMSCDHHILSHISSFGWWAAYLNNKKGKKVVGPYKYDFTDANYKPKEGFYPKNYIII
jgi:hypothetical protein